MPLLKHLLSCLLCFSILLSKNEIQFSANSLENIVEDDIEKRTELDLYYLENWSILFDIKIIFLTIWQMLTFSIPNAD